MAKKTAKKKPAPKKTAKKAPARKAPARKPAPRAAAAPAASRPRTGPVSSGRGPTPGEIGRAVVEHFNSGAHSDAPLWDRFWSSDFVSIEGIGMQWAGRADVEAKNADWMGKNIVHGASAEGPFVGSTGFAVKYRMDVEERGTGKRSTMEEVAVYTVQDGRVVREEFMYGGVSPS